MSPPQGAPGQPLLSRGAWASPPSHQTPPPRHCEPRRAGMRPPGRAQGEALHLGPWVEKIQRASQSTDLLAFSEVLRLVELGPPPRPGAQRGLGSPPPYVLSVCPSLNRATEERFWGGEGVCLFPTPILCTDPHGCSTLRPGQGGRAPGSQGLLGPAWWLWPLGRATIAPKRGGFPGFSQQLLPPAPAGPWARRPPPHSPPGSPAQGKPGAEWACTPMGSQTTVL